MAIDGLTIARFQRVENARQAQLLQRGGEFGDRIYGVASGSVEEIGNVAAEAAAAGIHVGVDRVGHGRGGLLVEAAGEDGLDGAVARIVQFQCALTGRFEASVAVDLGQASDALGGSQLVEDAIAEQPLDDEAAMATGALGGSQTVLRIGQRPGQRGGRQMIGQRRALAG